MRLALCALSSLVAPCAADLIGNYQRKSNCAKHSDCEEGKFCSFSYWTGHGWRGSGRMVNGQRSGVSTCRPCDKCEHCTYYHGYRCTYSKCDVCAKGALSVDGKAKCQARCGIAKKPDGPCARHLAQSGPPSIGQPRAQCDAAGNYEGWQCSGAHCWSANPLTGAPLQDCNRGLKTELKLVAKHCCGSGMALCQGGLPSTCKAKCHVVFEDVYSRCETEILQSKSAKRFKAFRTACDAQGIYNDGADNDGAGGH